MKEELKNKIKTSKYYKIILLIVSIAIIVLMFPKGESLESEISVGSIWIKDDLIASKTFEVPEDPVVYKQKQEAAAAKVNKVFILDESIYPGIRDSLKNYKKRLLKVLDTTSVVTNGTDLLNLSEESFNKLKRVRNSEKLIVTSGRKTTKDIFNIISILLNRVYKKGLLNLSLDEIEKDRIALRKGKFEELVRKTKFYDMESAKEYISNYLNNNFSFDIDLNDAVNDIISDFLIPNIIYSEEETELAIALAKSRVPRTKYIVNENERIVAKHDRITQEIKDKIDAYRKAKGEITSILEQASQYAGKVLHIIVILIIYINYLFLFRKRIFYDNVKLTLLAVLILFVSFLTFLIHQIQVNAPVQLLILIPVISILTTIVFDSRVGFYTTVISSLIAGGIHGNDYVFSVMNIVAGGLAVFSVRDIKNRNQIFRSFLFILVGYVASIFAFGLESYKSIQEILISSSFAASNALISPVLAYGLIIFVERIFRITTDLTLLELTDFNTPLLKELARKAPGTFNHSITIGSMVEAAAEVIDANPILARVGAYYHDIGKTLEPEGFVENQLSSNIHDEMNPRESVQVIINHVKGGIKLAEDYNLPKAVIDFIPMHHGTMVITYFYEKAKEILGEGKVSIDEFRYPGPKPNTKETTLVMLADACESAVRSMEQPEKTKVENIISNIFKQRLEDGQLDNSPITFKDLTKIKESYVNTLIGQHHRRIRYPNQEEMENESGEENV
ncbi:MAG: HDIG domain-containing protein [Ignavibacteria bacterium]|nr:MAG: HDIG domain-containing protein [Ignavibacteria bacterium]